MFDLLSNERRLIFLAYLSETESAALSDAATHVAAIERGVPREAITDETRRRTRLSLVQTHVLRLTEAGILAYDETDDRVRLVDEERLLAPFRTTDRRPGVVTVATGVIGVVVSAAGTALGAITPLLAGGQLLLFTAVILLGVRRASRAPSSVREIAARLELPVE